MELLFYEWDADLFILCRQVMWYTVLPIVSHFSIDQQRAVTHQDMLQCTNKGREEKDRKHVNNAEFKILIFFISFAQLCIHYVCYTLRMHLENPFTESSPHH